MTREEAIKIFLNRGWIEVENGTYFDGDKWREAIVVISDYFRNEYKALEQEPSGDLISRQDALDAIARIGLCKSDTKEVQAVAECLREVKKLQPVKQETVTEFADRCRECGKMRTGHWVRWYEIIEEESCTIHDPHCKCSECDKEYDPYISQFIKYCSNCGAKMIAESEVQE